MKRRLEINKQIYQCLRKESSISLFPKYLIMKCIEIKILRCCVLEEQRRPFHVSNLIDQRTSACTVKKSDERYLKNKTPSLYHFYWKLLSGFPFTHTMNMILKPVSYSQSEGFFAKTPCSGQNFHNATNKTQHRQM